MYDIKDLDQKLKTLSAGLKQEFLNIRGNRPTAALVENIKVDYAGQQFMIKQLGSISIVPPREIDISVWDKEAVGAVAKAIETVGGGLTANSEGNLIRIFLPALTDERRQELIKLIKAAAEQVKIRIRSLRDEENKKVEAQFKIKVLTEDQKFKGREQIQKAVDAVNQGIEAMVAAKVKEISE